MNEYKLVPHPDFQSPPGIGISVIAERQGGALNVVYFLYGDRQGEIVEIQDHYEEGRSDGLWKHTCFEAFVRVEGQPGYSELNFAPWGRWAAYVFDGYREGMRDLIGSSEPFVQEGYRGFRDDGAYGWDFGTIEAFDPAAVWHLGLTAVIKAKDGTKSYWALAHAPGPPDFHNPDCFIATLPAPKQP